MSLVSSRKRKKIGVEVRKNAIKKREERNQEKGGLVALFNAGQLADQQKLNRLLYLAHITKDIDLMKETLEAGAEPNAKQDNIGDLSVYECALQWQQTVSEEASRGKSYNPADCGRERKNPKGELATKVIQLLEQYGAKAD